MLQAPSTQGEWLNIAEGFNQRWNFPHCIGSLEGKYITIKNSMCYQSSSPSKDRAFSILLLVAVDADYKFMAVEFGVEGQIPDETVFKKSSFAKALTDNTLNIPDKRALPGMTVCLPYTLIADSTFPLQKCIMKPFSKSRLSFRKRIFNYRLSRARQVSDNAFGILISKFRIFQRVIHLSHANAKHVIESALCLHNYLMTRQDTQYCHSGLADVETLPEHRFTPGTWRGGVENSQCNTLPEQESHTAASMDAQAVRVTFARYFTSKNGCVAWQWNNAVGKQM